MPSRPSDTPSQSTPPPSEGLAARLAKLSPAQRRLLEQRLQRRPESSPEPIAVVGVGCRLPGAGSVESFWQLIRDGVDATSEIPPSRWDLEELFDATGTQAGKMSVRRGAFVDDVDRFDATFFGIAPREASRMDPQQRILLEVAWETFERSGVAPASIAGSKTGVYIGIGGTDYSKIPAQQPDYLEHIDAHVGTGNALSIAAGRLSYIFDLRGPSFIVDTACSSALVALHSAVQALRGRECDAALAGGVNLILSPEVTIAFSKARMLSPDGRCRPFDAEANGYVRGEGCALAYLKRLSDAQADGDPILGVIRGTAVNQDGRTSGITAPNSEAQRDCIRAALRQAGVSPPEISYIEAHGTGTPLGDPIEFQSLCEVYRRQSEEEQAVWVTSAKANIGHTETVSGMAGLLKVLLMLQHDEIPAQLNLDHLNPHIKLDGTRLVIPRERMTWKSDGRPRIAGISSFGFGGTNAHVILEEAPSLPPGTASTDDSSAAKASRPRLSETAAAARPAVMMLPVSGRSETALAELAARWADHLETHPELDAWNVCRTAASDRNHFSHRAAVIAENAGQLVEGLREIASETSPARGSNVRRGKASTATAPRIGFLFTGQGSQYFGMGRGLYEQHPAFRAVIDRAADVLDPLLPRPLRTVLYEGDDTAAIDQTEFTQPALVVIEMALCELWKSWGVRPDVVAGHSVGEYAAAWAAGVMNFEDALRLIAARGRLMQSLPEGGGMAAVLAPPERVAEVLREEGTNAVVIGAYNGPNNTVISGDAEPLDHIIARCEARSLAVKRLVVSHAFHSHRMDPILDAFRREVEQAEFKRPRITLLSNLTGRAMEAAPTADYWVDHIRQPVQFTACGQAMLEQGVELVTEIGPAPQLTGMMRQIADAADSSPVWLTSLRRGVDDWQSMISSLAEGYCAGAPIDLRRWCQPWPGQHVMLPTYPFARDRYWFDFGGNGAAGGTRHKPVHPLLGAPVDAAVEHRLFEAILRRDRPAYLADHVVQGSTVVPGAALMEVGLAAGRQIFSGEAAPRVESFVIQQALFLPETGGRQVQTLIEPERGGRATFQVFSRAPEGEAAGAWTLHARGVLVRDAAPVDEGATRRADVQRVRENPVDTKTQDEFYGLVDARGLTYGPAFRVLDTIHRTDREATAGLAAGATESPTPEYFVHPTLLDGCMQMMAAIVPLEADGSYNPNTFMPVAVGELTMRPGGRPSRIIARRTAPESDAPNPELVEGEVAILDEEDREVVLLKGVQVRRIGDRSAADSSKDVSRWLYQVAWEPAAETPAVESVKDQRWLVVGSESAQREAIDQRLRTAGCQVQVVRPQELTAGVAESDGAANATVLPEWLGSGDSQQQPLRGIVMLSAAEANSGGEVAETSTDACHQLMRLIQAAVRQAGDIPRVTVATLGAEPIDEQGDVSDLAGAALWGMGRSAQVEHPELHLQLVDLDPIANPQEQADVLTAELLSEVDEDQVGYRDGQRYAARLRPTPKVSGEAAGTDGGPLVLPSGSPYRLRLDGSNRIEGLWLERSGLSRPEPGKVELEVEAAGLNFSDVLKAMGLYPGITDAVVPMGIECAGVVTAVGEGVTRFAPGDRVLGVAPYSFASHAVTTEYALAACPPSLLPEEAATIPVTFLTAYYALVRLADLQPGERVLIHAGAGGVGLAAIQIAQHLGAEVFATAGSDTKRAFLRELGVKHLYNSRTLDFAEEILEETGRQGVDVVLNSLPGEAIDKSLSILTAYGRFLEIGKTDIYQNRMIGLQPFQDNLSYFAIDLDRVLRQRGLLVRSLFDEVMEHFAAGDYEPLPMTTFPILQVREAFRFMAQRKNIGKVVVDMRAETVEAESEEEGLGKRGTHLITGGLGALGLQVASWLVEQGASHLALLGRRGPSESAGRTIAALEQRGVKVSVLRGDVADTESLAAAVESLPQEFPPLRGVVHAAGALSDHMLYDMTAEQLDRALAPKIAGAWNLHRATEGQPLDYFVLFSSIAGLLGSPGQANYAAGNAFLDGLAHYRRGRGLPAVAINWGPWADAGMAAAEDRQANVTARGLQPLQAGPALGVMGHVLTEGPPQLAVLDARWSEMLGGRDAGNLPSLLRGPAELVDTEPASGKGQVDEALRSELLAAQTPARISKLREYFAQQLGAIMGLEPEQIEPEQSLGAMGLDSLMAIELKNTIETRLQVVLPMARFMEGPSLQILAEQVAELIGEPQEVAMVESQDADDDGRSVHALSHGQRALWFLNQLAPESTAYNICDAVRVHGPLDSELLQKSIQAIVDAHDAFRTVFRSEQGKPVAHVLDSLHVPVAVVDATSWDEERLRHAIHGEAHRPFDLETGPLIRVCAWREAEERHILFFSVHHISADFWSLVACTDQFRTVYAALREGKTVELERPAHQYRHFVNWQQRMLESPEGARHATYWKEHLSGELPILELPTDRPRPPFQTFRGGLAFRLLSENLTERLKSFASERGMTLNMLLLAGYQLLLHRLSGQDDVIVGLPTSGRSRAEFAGVVGYFVNPAVVRSRLRGNTTVLEYLEQVRQAALGALEHQDYPLPLLVDQLHPQRDPSRSTLFQALFVMQKAQILHGEGLTPFLMGQSGAKLEIADLVFESTTLDQWVAQFDLSLAASEADGGISLGLQYNSDLFDHATAERILDRFARLMQGLTDQADAPLNAVSVLDADERKTLLEDWGDGGPAPDDLEPVHQTFERQAARFPERIAVVCGDQRMRYDELNASANRLAHTLIDSGVAPGSYVGVCLPRGVSLITSILGILKAGAAYVPLDPKYPPARLRRIIGGTEMAAVVTNSELAGAIADADERTLCVDREASLSINTENPAVEIGLDDPIYVIYTSGSTGEPKGAGAYHRGFANLLRWYIGRFEITGRDVLLVVTSHGFDLTQKNLFAPLVAGGQLHLAAGEAFDPESVGQEIERGKVTFLNCTPSNFYPILEHPANLNLRRLKSLRWVVLGGEPIDRSRLHAWLDSAWCEATVANGYGPTECTAVVACHILQWDQGRDPSVPVGQPIPGVRLYVLDESLQLAPPGVAGELYIGGICVGAGYVNDAAMTREKFLPDPFSEEAGARMYASGDRCRWDAQGRLEFLGRNDHQVKIRGHRIELGEVEAAVGDLKGIREVVAMVREDVPGRKRLVAYVVADIELSADHVMRELQEVLPPQSIPAALVQLDHLPLTPHGKIDRRALAPPDESAALAASGYVAPRNEREQALADAWAEVLDVDRVGIHDNFFTVGGDSLLAIQVVARLSDAGWQCTPGQLLMRQTVASLAEVLKEWTLENDAVVINVSEGPLLPMQQWLFEQQFAHPDYFNMSVAVSTPSGLESSLLRQAVREMARRHEALRTRFEPMREGWRQVVDQHVPGGLLEEIQVSIQSSEEAETVVRRIVERMHGSLDPRAGACVRLAYLDFGVDAGGRLLLVAHHLVSDPLSLRILLEDLLTAYQSGGHLATAGSATGPVVWASALEERTQAGAFDDKREHWLALAQREVPRLALRFDAKEDLLADAVSMRTRLQPDAFERLAGQAIPGAIPALLLAGLVDAYRQSLRTDQLRVDVEMTGRRIETEGVDLSHSVGWFVSTFPVDLHSSVDAEPSEVFESTRRQLSHIGDDGIAYGALRCYGDSATRKALHQATAAEVRFNYLGRIRQRSRAAGEVALEAPEATGPNIHPRNHRTHAIEIDIWQEEDDGLAIRVTHSRHHRRNEVQRWLDAWIVWLETFAATERVTT